MPSEPSLPSSRGYGSAARANVHRADGSQLGYFGQHSRAAAAASLIRDAALESSELLQRRSAGLRTSCPAWSYGFRSGDQAWG